MKSTPHAPSVAAAPAPFRIAGLDGLRAIAVVAVIAYHFFPHAAVGGYVGVDVFFVISGFLITGLLVREHSRTGGIRLRAFWLRRARRLLPALALVVVACSAAAFFVGGDLLVGLGQQVFGAATFSSNWLSIARGASYFSGTTPELFRNLWSLAVEEQFYLLWPLLMLLLLLIKHRVARVTLAGCLALASAVAMALLAGSDTTRVYYGTDTHSFGLALGAALAFLLHGAFDGHARPAVGWRVGLPFAGALAAGGILAISLLMPDARPVVTHGGLAAVAVLTAVAIGGATAAGSWFGSALDVSPLRWIGRRSYGLYLWHWPVLLLFAAAVSPRAPWWVVPCCALVVTTGAAALSYRFVEIPVRRGGVRTTAASVWSRGTVVRAAAIAAVMVFGGLIALGGAAIAGDPGKTGAEIAVEQGRAALALAAAQAKPEEPTGPPAPASGDQIYAIGDSVMLAAAPQLQETFPGIAIDAEVSRPLVSGRDIVQSLVSSGGLRPILIIGLGTNGPIDESDLTDIQHMIGRKTELVVVNAQAPRDWIPGVNATIAHFAAQGRNVALANWHDTIAPRIDELSDDEIHPSGPISGGLYVSAIQAALQQLAERPPQLDSGAYRLIDRPV